MKARNTGIAEVLKGVVLPADKNASLSRMEKLLNMGAKHLVINIKAKQFYFHYVQTRRNTYYALTRKQISYDEISGEFGRACKN